MPDKPLELWYWIIPGDAYPFKRHRSTWLMTEEEAWRRYGSEAEKVDDSLEIRVVGKHSIPPRYRTDQPAQHE
jgi:hypothetical protein